VQLLFCLAVRHQIAHENWWTRVAEWVLGIEEIQPLQRLLACTVTEDYGNVADRVVAKRQDHSREIRDQATALLMMMAAAVVVDIARLPVASDSPVQSRWSSTD
jgi:hypothetical protein